MKSYSPGPWKTKSGLDVVIFEVSDKIYGKINDLSLGWHATDWHISGSYDNCDLLDLEPLEPERVEFESKVFGLTTSLTTERNLFGVIEKKDLAPFIGRRVNVIVEVKDET